MVCIYKTVFDFEIYLLFMRFIDTHTNTHTHTHTSLILRNYEEKKTSGASFEPIELKKEKKN